MLDRLQPWWYRLWKRHPCKAQVYNFIGYLYLIRAKEGASTLHDSDFYRRAIENLHKAIHEDYVTLEDRCFQRSGFDNSDQMNGHFLLSIRSQYSMF